MALDADIRKRLETATLTRSDVLAILEWQLSLPAEQIDCALLRECDLFLDEQTPGLDAVRREALYARLLARLDDRTPAGRRPGRPVHRARPRRALMIALLALLLLALAVGGVAYSVHRGVLNFTEDFGFARMVSLEGADSFVTSGSLAHLELPHVIVDVTEAVYDGAELRIVYSLTDLDGELTLAEHVENGYVMPGSEEGEVHMCDFVSVNGQDAYFNDTWEMPGDAPGQMLYYLQTNLPEWGVDVSGAQTLTIGLPMLPRPEGERAFAQVEFDIPAALPDDLLMDASLEDVRCGGHDVSIERATFSPLNGYIALRIEGLTREAYLQEMNGQCEVYAMDGSLLTDSRSEGPVDRGEDGSMTLGFTITPPETGWPEQMILALEFKDYSPDWEVVIRLEPSTAPSGA